MTTAKVEPSAIALGWSFQAQIDRDHILTAQTHVPLDASPTQINAALDKMADAMDRIKARYRKIELEQVIAGRQTMLESAKKDMDILDDKMREDHARSGRRGEFQLTSKQQADRNNFKSTIDRMQMEMTDAQAELEACRRMLNGSGAGAGA